MRFRRWFLASVTALVVLVVGGVPASASPDRSAAIYTGYGFDTCSAPALSYIAGVYGSAASTIRDMIPLAQAGTGPDAVWLGHWNGVQSVFGDSYVSDSYWADHQRLHQYSGGHKATYGGVTINIDSNVL